MADSEWNVTTFLNKLAKALVSDNLNETIIDSFPDIDGKWSWHSYWEENKEVNEKKYWNQSVKNLWENWKNLDNDSEDDSNKIKRVKNADAGWRFTGEPYVNPDLNIDNEAYEKVRGDDKIESVLKNNKQMQYTHSQQQIEGSAEKQNQSKYTKDGKEYNKYIRLLMPKYLRRVEVEDLNRNFWVIAQTIGLISEYLLDPNSLLNKLLEGILKEIIQLWDNTHRIWEALYALGEKVNNHDVQISNIAEATQKTKVGISLNTYPSYETKGKEFRRMLGRNINGEEKITLEQLYFFYKGVSNNSGTADIAAIAQWIAGKAGTEKNIGLTNTNEMKEFFGIEKSIDPGENYTNYIGAINEYMYSVIKGENNYKNYVSSSSNNGAFRIGCAIVYSTGSDEDKDKKYTMVVYDQLHPYYPSTSDFFGPYRWCRRLGTNGAALLINDIIKGIYDEDEVAAKSILNSSTDSDQHYGPITVERDGVNKKPLNKILAEISGFNFAFLDAFGMNSVSDYSHVLTKDLMPNIIKYKDMLKGFLGVLCDFETSGLESYREEKGENVSVIWTIPPIINKKAFLSDASSRIERNVEYEELGRLYINKLKDFEEISKGIDELKQYYDNFLTNRNNDNYYNLVYKFLTIMKLTPNDLMPNETIIASADGRKWLSSYENRVESALNDENYFCYKYFTNGSSIWNSKIYSTCMPWLILEPTYYSSFTNIHCGNDYQKAYSSVVKDENGNYDSNMWKLISSILPVDCFQVGGGLKLVPDYKDNGESKEPELKWKNIYGEGNDYGPLNNLAESDGVEIIKDKYYEALKIPFILSSLRGWDESRELSRSVGMSSLQPYYSKSLDNYWISFSSADLTGGRVHMRIVNSNYRFFSPFLGCKGVMSGSVGQCYDASPHNTSIILGYSNPLNAITEQTEPEKSDNQLKKIKLNQILNFNTPEYSPNGMYNATERPSQNDKVVYDYSGNIKNGKKIYVVKSAENEKEKINVVSDGFLGYANLNDFYLNKKTNSEYYSRYYEFYKNDLLKNADGNNFTNNIYEKINVTEADPSDSEKEIYSYEFQGPAFWTQGIDGEGTRSKDNGTFYKVREVHPQGTYGILNGNKMNKSEIDNDSFNYNEIYMKDLLPGTFFDKNKSEQIYTLQVEFQRYSISGSTRGVYATIYMGKDTREVEIQKNFSTTFIPSEEGRYFRFSKREEGKTT